MDGNEAHYQDTQAGYHDNHGTAQHGDGYHGYENGYHVNDDTTEYPDTATSGDDPTLTPLTSTRLRLMVVTTGPDTEGERAHLRRDTFPRVREYCAGRGVEFTALDPHYGTPGAGQGLDHHPGAEQFGATQDDLGPYLGLHGAGLHDLCMGEVRRCLEVSLPAPCLLLLSTDLPGTPPLPRTVPADILEIILPGVQSTAVKRRIKAWYIRDDNNTPPVYTLRDPTLELLELPDESTTEERRVRWAKIEREMVEQLRTSALRSDSLSREEKEPWTLPDTHQQARLVLPTQPDRCLAVFRSITGIHDPETLQHADRKVISRFLMLTNRKRVIEVDESAQYEVAALREEVTGSGVRAETFTLPWTEWGMTADTHDDYLNELGAHVYDVITQSVAMVTTTHAQPDTQAEEIRFHTEFAEREAAGFTGRGLVMDQLIRYLDNLSNPGAPLVVTGTRGSGKTAILAAAHRAARDRFPGAILVLRHCGMTSHSRHGRLLLQSVMRQILDALALDVPVVAAFSDLKDGFAELLLLAEESCPIILLLDGVDRMDIPDVMVTSTSWLPTELPDYVRIIVTSSSTSISGGEFPGIPPTNVINIDAIHNKDKEKIFSHLLKQRNRSLQPKQLKAFIKQTVANGNDNPSALRIKYLAGMAADVTSLGDVPDVGDVMGMIGGFLGRIEGRHGGRMVGRVLGMLSVSGSGLGEGHIRDLLSVDTQLVDEISTGDAPKHGFPEILIASLLCDLEDHIVMTLAYGRSVYWFRNSTFQKAVRDRYIPNLREKQRLVKVLGDYFSDKLRDLYPSANIQEQPLYWEGPSGVIFNTVKLAVLPDLLTQAGAQADFEGNVCSLVFLAAKFWAGLGREALEDLRKASVKFHSPMVQQYKDFLVRNVRDLERNPRQILQLATQEEEETEVYMEADFLPTATPWLPDNPVVLTQINKPVDLANPCLKTLHEYNKAVHTIVLTYAPALDKRLITTVYTDTSVSVWDIEDDKETFHLHVIDDVTDTSQDADLITCVTYNYDNTSEDEEEAGNLGNRGDRRLRLYLGINTTLTSGKTDDYVRVYLMTYGHDVTGTLLYSLSNPGMTSVTSCIAVTSDGGILITNVTNGNNSGTLDVYKVTNNRTKRMQTKPVKLGERVGDVTRMCVLPGDKYLAAVSLLPGTGRGQGPGSGDRGEGQGKEGSGKGRMQGLGDQEEGLGPEKRGKDKGMNEEDIWQVVVYGIKGLRETALGFISTEGDNTGKGGPEEGTEGETGGGKEETGEGEGHDAGEDGDVKKEKDENGCSADKKQDQENGEKEGNLKGEEEAAQSGDTIGPGNTRKAGAGAGKTEVDLCVSLEARIVEPKVWLLLVAMKHRVTVFAISAKDKKMALSSFAQVTVERESRAIFQETGMIMGRSSLMTWSGDVTRSRTWQEVFGITPERRKFVPGNATEDAHEADITSLVCEGDYLVSGSRDGCIKIWNCSLMRRVSKSQPRHAQKVSSCTLLPGSSTVFTASGREVWRWDGTSGNLLARFSFPAWVDAIVVTPDDLPNGEPQQVALQSWAEDAVYFLPVSDLETDGGEIQTYNTIVLAEGSEVIRDIPTERLEFHACQDCKYMSAVSSKPEMRNTVSIINLQWPFEYNKVFPVDEHESEVHGAIFSPDGALAVTWCGNEETGNRRMTLWDLASLQEYNRSPDVDTSGRYFYFTQVVFLPDEQYYSLVAGTSEGKLLVYDLQTLEPVMKVTAHAGYHVTIVRVTWDGRHVVTYGDDGYIKVWRTPTLEEAGSLYVKDRITCMTLSYTEEGHILLQCGQDSGRLAVIKVKL